jgi:hypothetical protein
MYSCRHFKIYEIVPPSVYEKYGERAWWFLNPSLLELADALRDDFGSCTVNDYKWGGKFSQSGLRTSESQYYNPFSQHALGNALDMKFKISADEVREQIKSNPDKYLAIAPSITLEEGVSWVHIDVRNAEHGIRTFTP